MNRGESEEFIDGIKLYKRCFIGNDYNYNCTWSIYKNIK